METVTTSRSPMTVITANGEGDSLCHRVGNILDNESPRGHSSSSIAGKALRRTWTLIRVDSFKNGIRIQCNTENFVLIVVPGLSTSSFSSLLSSPPMTSSTEIDHSDSQVKVWIDMHRETRTLLEHQKSCYVNQPKSQNQIKMRITNRYGEARILPTLRKTSQESINLERKSYLDCSLDTLRTRREFGRGWHDCCRRWGAGNDGHIGNLQKKTQCKGSDISQRKCKISFTSRRWTNHTRWKRSGTENIHLGTASTNSRRK